MMRRFAIALLLVLPALAQNDPRLVAGYGRAGWNGTTFAHNYSGKSPAGIVTTNFIFNTTNGFYQPKLGGIVSNGIISQTPTIISSNTSWCVALAFSSTNKVGSHYMWAESRQDTANLFIYTGTLGSNIYVSARGMSGGSTYFTLRATNLNVLDGTARMIVTEHTGTTFNIFIDDVLWATTNAPAFPATGMTGAVRQTVGYLERNDGGDGTDSFRGTYEFLEVYTPALDAATRSKRYQQWRATKP